MITIKKDATVYDREGFRMYELNVSLCGETKWREAGWVIGSAFYPMKNIIFTECGGETVLTHVSAGWFVKL